MTMCMLPSIGLLEALYFVLQLFLLGGCIEGVEEGQNCQVLIIWDPLLCVILLYICLFPISSSILHMSVGPVLFQYSPPTSLPDWNYRGEDVSAPGSQEGSEQLCGGQGGERREALL